MTTKRYTFISERRDMEEQTFKKRSSLEKKSEKHERMEESYESSHTFMRHVPHPSGARQVDHAARDELEFQLQQSVYMEQTLDNIRIPTDYRELVRRSVQRHKGI